jgi:Ser/Thr protein kinase RdoA (MazF antagonist)
MRGSMNASFAHESDTYRLLIARRNASDLLLIADRHGFSLPSVEIPRRERIPPRVTEAVKNLWGFEAVCLFTPASTSSPSRLLSPIRYQVLEPTRPNDEPPAGCYWVSLTTLSEGCFADPEDHRAIRTALDQWAGYADGSISGTFGKSGWLREVFNWVDHEIAALGLRTTGQFRQLNASPTFSLVRFETNGAAIWFKAVGELNLRELQISQELARLFAGFVPRIIAVHEAWNAWLTSEVEGTHPDANSEIAVWTTVARTLADLQLASRDHTLHLIEAGCKDLRACTLPPRVDPFLDAMAGLLDEQTKDAPVPPSRRELAVLGTQLKDALSSYQNLEFPDTLGHFDFNPGNVLTSADCCVFLDWAEAFVGPPFLTFEYLLAYLRRFQREDVALQAALRSTYAAIWKHSFPPKAISEAFAMARLVAVFGYAVSLAVECDSQKVKHSNAPFLRSLTRRMKREAELLMNQNGQCALPSSPYLLRAR